MLIRRFYKAEEGMSFYRCSVSLEACVALLFKAFDSFYPFIYVELFH